MFGVLLALLSALSFGLSQTLVRKNLHKSNFLYITLTVTIMGNIILWPLALAFTDLNTINNEGILLFIIAGLLAPGVARLFYFKGMETAGMSTNASIFSTYPLYTSITATLLLGEALTTENWIGLICIIVGVIFIGRNINNSDTQTTNTTKKGIIIAFLGSLAMAFSQILRKEGLNIYNEPLLGVAAGYTTSLIVYLLVIRLSRTTETPHFSLNDVRNFWKPGVGIATGWLLAFIALSQEMVSIVAPVLQTELLFILFFAYVFLRKQEKISLKLAASAILIVTGVILVTIN
ncbi:MAG TPA: DMT family transporter [Acidobacteriota bacterium]|nr:DMT family transporter [Acidobacteriota bacterium]